MFLFEKIDLAFKIEKKLQKQTYNPATEIINRKEIINNNFKNFQKYYKNFRTQDKLSDNSMITEEENIENLENSLFYDNKNLKKDCKEIFQKFEKDFENILYSSIYYLAKKNNYGIIHKNKKNEINKITQISEKNDLIEKNINKRINEDIFENETFPSSQGKMSSNFENNLNEKIRMEIGLTEKEKKNSNDNINNNHNFLKKQENISKKNIEDKIMTNYDYKFEKNLFENHKNSIFNMKKKRSYSSVNSSIHEIFDQSFSNYSSRNNNKKIIVSPYRSKRFSEINYFTKNNYFDLEKSFCKTKELPLFMKSCLKTHKRKWVLNKEKIWFIYEEKQTNFVQFFKKALTPFKIIYCDNENSLIENCKKYSINNFGGIIVNMNNIIQKLFNFVTKIKKEINEKQNILFLSLILNEDQKELCINHGFNYVKKNNKNSNNIEELLKISDIENIMKKINNIEKY